MNEIPRHGELLLRLLALLGWEVSVTRGDGVRVTASRPDGIQVEAVALTLADASLYAYEQAFRAIAHRRKATLAPAA
ncbi:MAG TPA: hypothetical protein VGQ15_10290 [Gaiellaceae bacterium]|jgi:hypothetical protein|nr:hypothetical protein [Gaiellaceae bacterium]